MIISKIIVHNTGGYGQDPNASTKHLMFEDIEKAHKERWGFVSTLNFFGGYTFVIDARGVVTQARSIGEETAHTRGHNSDSIGIVLTGNFNKGVDSPTGKQIESLTQLLRNLMHSNFAPYKVVGGTRLHLNMTRIFPHRYYGRTSCYGTGLKDMWARELLKVQKVVSQGLSVRERLTALQEAIQAFQRLLLAFKRSQNLGGHGYSCWLEDERN